MSLQNVVTDWIGSHGYAPVFSRISECNFGGQSLKKYYILLSSLIPQEIFSFEQELENVYFLYISF